MKNLKPFRYRVTVIESPVDEAQRDSGLIVPFHVGDTGGHEPSRGVVVGVHPSVNEREAEEIEVGMVIYYTQGWKIVDQIVVYIDDIVAYETA